MVYPPYGGDWVGVTERMPLAIGTRLGVEFWTRSGSPCRLPFGWKGYFF
jgi:hypothetical protein